MLVPEDMRTHEEGGGTIHSGTRVSKLTVCSISPLIGPWSMLLNVLQTVWVRLRDGVTLGFVYSTLHRSISTVTHSHVHHRRSIEETTTTPEVQRSWSSLNFTTGFTIGWRSRSCRLGMMVETWMKELRVDYLDLVFCIRGLLVCWPRLCL